MNSTKNTLSPTIFQHQNRVPKHIDNRSDEKVTGFLKTDFENKCVKIQCWCNPNAKKSV
jgi:hypothetical protein